MLSLQKSRIAVPLVRSVSSSLSIIAYRSTIRYTPRPTTSINTQKQFHSSQLLKMAEIPEKQTAFVFKNGSFALDKKEIEVPKPDAGKVLLKVAAAGVCHSDLHVLHGGLPYPDGLILGHEIAGHIVAYGDGVDKAAFPSDALYAVVGPNPCGMCKACRTGADNVCEDPSRTHMGLGSPGGYEQYTQVSARNITKVPEGIPAAVAAASTDAVLTPYHALKRAGINGMTRLLIVGLGGLGINAVQIAKAFGSYVIAVDPKETSRDLAKQYGANEVYAKLPEESLDVDVAADFYGSQATFDLCQKHVKAQGILLPVGLQDPKLTFDLNHLAFREYTIIGNFWGTSQDQTEVFELVKKGLVTPQVETTSWLNVNKVLKDLDEGKIKSRMVLVHNEDN